MRSLFIQGKCDCIDGGAFVHLKLDSHSILREVLELDSGVVIEVLHKTVVTTKSATLVNLRTA